MRDNQTYAKQCKATQCKFGVALLCFASHQDTSNVTHLVEMQEKQSWYTKELAQKGQEIELGRLGEPSSKVPQGKQARKHPDVVTDIVYVQSEPLSAP